MGEMSVYRMGTGAGPSFSEGLGTDDSVSRLILSNNLLYNLCSFVQKSVYLRKGSLLKMVCVEQKIILSCTWHIKEITIILIPNKYHQFRIQHKFISMNFTGKKYIGFTAKNMKVRCFEFITQKDLLRYFPFKMPNRCVIVYMSCSYHWKLLLGIQ